MSSFHRILVPTDFDAASETAFARAKELATALHATIRLLHVVDHARATAHWSSDVYVGVSPGIAAAMMAEADRRLKTLVTEEERARFGIVYEVRVASPAELIQSVARDEGIDLIVMGTHGRRGLAHMLLGSVAERVVRIAPCAVLTVHADYAGAAAAAETTLAVAAL